MPPGPPRWLPPVAWANVASHLLASGAMCVWLVPGFPDGHRSLDARMAWVQGHPTAWTTAWLCWHPAALTLAATVVGLLRFGQRMGVGRRRWAWHTAIACLGCAVVADLTGQWIYIQAAGDVSAMRFAAYEGWAGQLTGLVANGLYTGAVAAACWTVWNELPRLLRACTGIVTVGGVGLSLATVDPWPPGQMAATAILMPGVILWSGLVARWAAAA